ncbi:hypothetical protein AVEN_37636-1 [Araneus ventricosus]|uniref:Uncharacterized protein n=1 Tax=Araneus ventricosus TaxID=182803 RepID=A0A4Y2ACK1_ARAVE|nr:hypothetical protein AVEN_37636-1 [Araneus ventricosus]
MPKPRNYSLNKNPFSYSKVVRPATCSCGKKIQQPTNNQPAGCQSAQTEEQITQVFCMPLAKLKSNNSKSETTTVSTVLTTQTPKSSTNVKKKSQNTK